MMNKMKSILGIIWALAGLIIIIVLFPGLTGYSKALSSAPFMRINPNYSGGEIFYSKSHAEYKIDIRKPVFSGLTGEKEHGFIQLDWRGNLASYLIDTIDYNNDGENDFIININTLNSETELEPLNGKVTGLNISTSTSYGWSSRINLIK